MPIKVTPILLLATPLILVGIPLGIHGFTLDGGAMLEGVLIFINLFALALILWGDRYLVKRIKYRKLVWWEIGFIFLILLFFGIYKLSY